MEVHSEISNDCYNIYMCSTYPLDCRSPQLRMWLTGTSRGRTLVTGSSRKRTKRRHSTRSVRPTLFTMRRSATARGSHSWLLWCCSRYTCDSVHVHFILLSVPLDCKFPPPPPKRVFNERRVLSRCGLYYSHNYWSCGLFPFPHQRIRFGYQLEL